MKFAWSLVIKESAHLLAYRGTYSLAAGISCLVFLALKLPVSQAQIALPDVEPLSLPETDPPQFKDRPKSIVRPKSGDNQPLQQKAARPDKDANGYPIQTKDDSLQKKPIVKQPEAKASPAGLDVYVDASLMLSRSNISAKDGRVDSEEPSTRLSTWTRVSSSNSQLGSSVWMGMRMASFSGHILNQSESIRYNFTYIGPGIALGTLYSDLDTGAPTRADGLFLKLGISGVSRRTSSNPATSSTFNTVPFVSDNCGCWVETQWIKQVSPTISLSTHLGVQTGLRKSFTYLGIGSLLWF